MKSYTAKFFLLLFSGIFFISCQKDHGISKKQAILFQLDYVNYAWGYQHNGFVIDNEGNILTYNNPQDWNFPDNELTLFESQVEENISKCVPTGRKITSDELKKYSNYIKNIASSKVTALKNAGADAGSHEYICYQFSESTRKYKGHIIKMEGDFTCENLNYYSKKVVVWMKNINSVLISE